MKTFPTLYKRTSTGKVQEWKMELNPNNPSQYRTVSGQVDGKHTESAWKQAKGKNIGKVNETTPEEQAISEIESRYVKKLDGEYSETIENVDEAKSRNFIPMTAKTHENGDQKKEETIHEYPVWSQPKLDGMRCIITKDGMFSRNGKAIVSAPHIFNSLKSLFLDYPNIILDGELYSHNFHDDFNKIMSLAKKTKPAPDDLLESERYLEFHMFDYPSRDLPFELRFIELENLYRKYYFNYKFVKVVKTVKCNSKEELDTLYSEYADDGYEGQMIRYNGPYENKRSKQLWKRKDWIDNEFKLVSFEEGEGNASGLAAKAWFKYDPDGPLTEENMFKANVRGNMEYRKELLENKEQYVDTFCTVIYCPQLTPDGVPRFGRVKEIDRKDNI